MGVVAVKRIVVAGGTGFIGRHLVRALAERGDEVSVLSRSAETVERALGAAARAVVYRPLERGDWYEALNGADVVVNLAGEQVVGRRHTKETKRRVRESRVETTHRLVEAIAEAKSRPRLLVSASGVDYYGAHDSDQAVDETSSPGVAPLARLCVEWEEAARRAEAYGVRVVCCRFGIVLAADGGALEQMVRPFRFFAGGPIGSGEQVVSWVHIDDAVNMLLCCIDETELAGPVNVVSPNAVTNAELAQAIGRSLGRPSWLPAPGFALKLMFGAEGAQPILTGRRVVPEVMRRHRFVWRYPDLDAALAQTLG
jgi:uncharacterized protein (TIGR01777 family)